MRGLYTVRADDPKADCVSVAYSPRRECRTSDIARIVREMRTQYPSAIVRVFDPNGNRDSACEATL
jgi:hypothetical protein